ncbi:MAG: hypothetical protein HC871_02740 [Rhizobiales bacterium]|nr:hypothetical protein [Hyphomicrobiales bacterium]
MNGNADGLNRDQGITLSGADMQHHLLNQLRKDGWVVRLKRQAARPSMPADSLNRALYAALEAYRRAGRLKGETDLPCRAAIRAYRQVRPDDANGSERIVRALIMAVRNWPGAFVSSTAASA